MISPRILEALQMAKEMPDPVAVELLIETLQDYRRVPSAALEHRSLLLCNVFLMKKAISILGYEEFRKQIITSVDATHYYKTLQQ